MTQSGVSAFARFARRFAASAVVLLASAGALAAQTGKIEGRVRDQAGAPIQNAQVVIVGTAFSALTNPQGYYFINNVPPATITLRASFIGYKRTEVAGVKVLAGQTITQDIQLESSAVQIEEITVVPADNPLVPRDEVTTKQRIDGEFTEALPVDRITQVLALQPGVVANAGTNNLSIRGGRIDEANFYVDGVPVQPGNRGTGFQTAGTNSVNSQTASGVTFATNSFEEVSVTTGAASAEFGNAQAGVLNLVSRTGGSKFAGRLAAESDEPFGSVMGMGYNRVEGNLSGPLFANGLSFAVGGAIEGNKSARSGKGREDFPVFVQAGVDTTVDNDGTLIDVPAYAIYSGDCDTFAGNVNSDLANNYGESCHGARTPQSNFSAYQVNGNINLSYGTGSRIRASAALSQNQGKNLNYGAVGGGANGQYLNLANAQTGFNAQNRVYTLNWTQNLTKSTERALALDVNLSYQQDRFVQSPFEENNLPGEGTMGFYFKKLPFRYGLDLMDQTYDVGGVTYTKLDCYIRNIQSCLGALDLGDQALVAAQQQQTNFRSNPYGLRNSVFPDGGNATARLFLTKEDRMVARGALDWQVDRYNRLKIGGEFVQYDMQNYSAQLTSQAFSDFYHEKPQRYAAFIEDRLDIGDVVVQLGVRYDRYDTRASRWADFPRVSTNPGLAAGQDPTDLYVRDQAHDYISPRVQVAFPVTEKTNFRLSYAHAVQSPDFALVLSGINTDLSTTNTNNVYGTDLDFGKSITFEFGIRHAFNDDMVLDLSAYNRDNLANAAGRLVSRVDPISGNPTDLRLATNADFGNTRGIDIRLDRRFGQLFNGTLAYSYTDAQSTGSDPFTYINFGSRLVNSVTGGNQPPPQAIAPVALSRPHSFVGALALTFPNGWQSGSTIGSIFQNFSVFTSFRFTSGTAYTACEEDTGNQAVLSGGVCGRGGFQGGLNSERLPFFKQLDMRFVKGFNLGTNQFAVYLDARNILNFTNTLTQYVTTKDIVSPIDRDQNFAGDSTFFAQEGDANGVLGGDGSLDLTFGGAGASGCGGWVDTNSDVAVPNCVSLIRAEQRWGNGDGILTLAEQAAASDALYYSNGRAPYAFYGAGTQLRLGVEFNF